MFKEPNNKFSKSLIYFHEVKKKTKQCVQSIKLQIANRRQYVWSENKLSDTILHCPMLCYEEMLEVGVKF